MDMEANTRWTASQRRRLGGGILEQSIKGTHPRRVFEMPGKNYGSATKELWEEFLELSANCRISKMVDLRKKANQRNKTDTNILSRIFVVFACANDPRLSQLLFVFLEKCSDHFVLYDGRIYLLGLSDFNDIVFSTTRFSFGTAG